MKRIAVFCGSMIKPGEPEYNQAMQLGTRLAEAGYAVMTGGYIGAMEAVSRGAFEAGGHVIGVTCDEIEKWRQVAPNPWIKQEIRFGTIRQRMFALIEGCDAALALPGGIGTLTEIMVMWNHLLVRVIAPRPLILIGKGWQNTIKQFYECFDKYIPENLRTWVNFAIDSSQAVNYLNQQL